MTGKEKKDFEKWVKAGDDLLLKKMELEDAGKDLAEVNERIETLLGKFVYAMKQILERSSKQCE